MLLEIILLSFGTLLLHPCVSILFDRKPAVKADNLKRFAMAIFYMSLIKHFVATLIPVIRQYGSSFAGIVSMEQVFYFDIAMVFLWAVLLIRSSFYYAKLTPTSLALTGIPKEYALPVLYKTLSKMGLRYQKNVAQINLPDQNLDIGIDLTEQELRFRVDKALDKIFLQRLCRAYQEQYQAEKLPLKKIRLIVFLLLGLLLSLVAVYDIAAILIQAYFTDWKGFFPSISSSTQVVL